MRGLYVCEQSALVGDSVAEHQVWDHGSGCGWKRSNNIEMHQRGGHTVLQRQVQGHSALMDGEFIPLRGGLAELGLRLNETSRDGHVGDIERYI